MSDFYEGRMIPLKIADMAIISCNKEIEKLQIDNASLKAEVEELKRQPDPLTAYLYAAELAKDNIKKLKAENTYLKAEVERLRKAGDAMASSIQFNEEMAKDYNGPTIVHQSVKAWNAAKEGKPSV